MRIISGSSKGRKLATQRGQSIRPTSDRVKESIFNILGDEVKGKTVLDLFAGTGNLGVEALSRGAERVVFVEKGRQAVRLIHRNVAQCGMEGQTEILATDAHRAIGILYRKGTVFDLILMDPPYERGLVERTLMKLRTQRIYHPDSMLVVEHSRREPLSGRVEGWDLVRQREIGDTVLSFLVAKAWIPAVEEES